MTDIRLPNISASADASTQMAQMRSYLYQMVEQLNWSLSALDSGGTASLPVQTASLPVKTVGQAAPATSDETDQRMANLRDLIIKSAESVQTELDTMDGRFESLSGTYVARSDFGTYREDINQRITANSTKIEQQFAFASEIQANTNRVEVDFAAYKTDVEGYIRQGIVGYDGTIPIIGIAIGQDIRTTRTGVETDRGVFDEIDKSSNMSVWTTEKLSFYIGGQEAAYFSNGKLTVAQIATDRIAGAGKWDVSFTNGVKFKWMGG